MYCLLVGSQLCLLVFVIRMLDDLSTRVEHTDSKLGKVQRTMGDFIRRNEGESLEFQC